VFRYLLGRRARWILYSRRDLIVAYGKRMDRIRADTGKEIRLGM